MITLHTKTFYPRNWQFNIDVQDFISKNYIPLVKDFLKDLKVHKAYRDAEQTLSIQSPCE